MRRCGIGGIWRDEDEMGVMGLVFILVPGPFKLLVDLWDWITFE